MRAMAIGATGGLIAALLLAWPAGDAAFDLADARGERAAVEAELARPAPAPATLLRAGQALTAPDAAAARAELAKAVHWTARGQALLVEELAPAPALGPRTAAVRLSVSGGDKGLLAVLDALEGTAPAARFQAVSVEALPDGGLRLKGTWVAAWHR